MIPKIPPEPGFVRPENALIWAGWVGTRQDRFVLPPKPSTPTHQVTNTARHLQSHAGSLSQRSPSLGVSGKLLTANIPSVMIR
jgi:hypothetical protein